jgi:hypothetical protein
MGEWGNGLLGDLESDRIDTMVKSTHESGRGGLKRHTMYDLWVD